MKLRSLTVLFTLAALPVFGQSLTDTIEVRRNTYRMHGEMLKPSQLLDAMRQDPTAFHEMRRAKRNFDYGMAFGGVGGFVVGWPLGAALAGGELNWAVVGAGAGLIVVGIPFTSAYNRHARSAVATFNEGLRGPRSQLKFGTTPTGVGLVLHF